MEKVNYNKLNYSIYLLFSLLICFFFFSQKNKDVEVKKHIYKKESAEEKKQINIKPKPILMTFKDIVEVKNLKKNHTLKNKSLKSNKKETVKIEKLNPENYFSSNIKIKKNNQKKKNSHLLKPLKEVKVEKKKNDFLSLLSDPIEKSYVKKNKLTDFSKIKPKSKITASIKYSITKGSKFLDNEEFTFSFKWPQDTYYHNKIYSLLKECLGVRGIIIDKNRNLFSYEGKLKKHETKLYSRILRSPSDIYSSEEKQNVHLIRKKFNLINRGVYYRMFEKKVDAFIIGKFLSFAKNIRQKMKFFSGEYILIDNILYIDNLEINGRKIPNKIDLSEIFQSCN